MPPRKSNVSVASANGEPAAGPTGTPSGKEKEKKDKDKDEIAIEDLTMPRTMIQRLAKGVLPEGTQLQKDAVTALCKSATVFVSHIAGAAADECAMANRRTVNPTDVFAALRETEHAAMVPRLEQELAKWVEVNTTKRNEYRRKMKEKADGAESEGEGAEGGDGPDGMPHDGEQAREGVTGAEAHDVPRSAKRVKGADGAATAPGEGDDTMEVDEGEDDEGDGQEEEEDEEEEDEEEDDDAEDEKEGEDAGEGDVDPASAQLERESHAVNEGESDEESD